MTKRLILTLAGILVLVTVLGGGGLYLATKAQPPKIDPAETTPTFYLHGYGGSANSTKNMIAYARKHYGATQVIVARVDAKGQVSFNRPWTASTKRPIIQVIYENNRNSDFKTAGTWFKNVVAKTADEYHFKKFNVVAHSMGNLSLMYYLADYGQDQHLPQLARYVALAGHFDGIRAIDDPVHQNYLLPDGRPAIIHSYYQYLLDHQDQFPKNQIDILNIYGDLDDGSDSDGSVTNVSSRSLAYLVGDRARSYQEKAIHGPGGQHSRLHENTTVDQLVGNFLWPN
ncbi:alpha/beta hydrolase [Lactobacillaceae bacterium L1_55_11]|nr:alpha/beta hydrolase [Lactobacillaceae bacterium L1_55_11]